MPVQSNSLMFAGIAPANVNTPPSGYLVHFHNSTTGTLCQKNSSGVVVDLTATGGGSADYDYGLSNVMAIGANTF